MGVHSPVNIDFSTAFRPNPIVNIPLIIQLFNTKHQCLFEKARIQINSHLFPRFVGTENPSMDPTSLALMTCPLHGQTRG
jgi:hypothetical protein